MSRAENDGFALSGLKTIKRKAVNTSSEALVKINLGDSGEGIPVVVQPEVEEVDLIAWGRANLETIEAILLKQGAILFRNFAVSSISQFEDFARATSSGLIDYSEPSTARTELSDKVYTSTEYPQTETLPLHNEMSYSHVWPMKIWFNCVKPADEGGETPIGDSRKVFQILDPRLKQQFIEKKVMYVRNYDEGIGLSWQSVFHTDSKEVLEAYCRQKKIEFEWLDEKRLRTRQIRQAVERHPKTGDMVWFNQAHIHNILNLPPAFRESLLSLVETRAFPLDINSFYGDGSEIESSVFEEIHDAYRQAAVTFPWQQGDVLMLDNMLVAHARAPFKGERKIVVAMAEAHSPNG